MSAQDGVGTVVPADSSSSEAVVAPRIWRPSNAPASSDVASDDEDLDHVAAAASDDSVDEAAAPEGAAPVGGSWHVYCDLDGVLADFEGGVEALLGKDPDAFRAEGRDGDRAMWTALAQTRNFFTSLEWMPDGKELWAHLRSAASGTDQLSLSVLSGCPRGNWSLGQKRRWCREQLGRDIVVELCWARDKPLWSAPGRILVDDNDSYREAWESKGGVFIHHRNTAESIVELQRVVAEPAPAAAEDDWQARREGREGRSGWNHGWCSHWQGWNHRAWDSHGGWNRSGTWSQSRWKSSDSQDKTPSRPADTRFQANENNFPALGGGGFQ